MNAANQEIHEAKAWGEMKETLQEMYELQEQEAQEFEASFPTASRIVTPAVIIRITLAPGRGRAIFGSPRAIAGAVLPRQTVASPQIMTTGPQATRLATTNVVAPVVRRTPVTGRAIIPIRVPDAATGQIGKGVVFVPRKGSNVVQIGAWTKPGSNPLRTAGNWLVKQAKKTPALTQRMRRIQVLVDGKPCQTCVKNLHKKVAPVVPPGANLKVRFATSAAGVSPQKQAMKTVAPALRSPIQKKKLAATQRITPSASAMT
ncbi:MAG: hypothetical protein AAB316_23695, partial [Bacteroidota bacterium]